MCLDTKLQDVLRLLHLWFRYGDVTQVSIALQTGFNHVSIDTWLLVIPQIIARLHVGKPKIRSLIQGLLVEVGCAHPQALVYPLTVALQSENITRKKSAKSLLNKICENRPRLVEDARMVSRELIRTAILWHEKWHSALIDASRLFWGKTKNEKAMIERLRPMYDELSKPPTTLREQAFVDAFKSDLLVAWDLVKRFQKSGDDRDMLRAWEYYRKCYARIDKQLPSLIELELQYVSPQLKSARNLQTAIPGTYQPHLPIISIVKFESNIAVFDTQQRPRKLNILGSDGLSHEFLLKGREDLRQDERVMQLFGLVNRLLSAKQETAAKNLSITTYSVIPLAPICGMIGWVSYSPTLHAVIEAHRESCGLIFGVEHAFVKEEYKEYDDLPLSNKLEIFEDVLRRTKGGDLRDMLWMKSWNAETWLKKRCEYTRSLALMSMVGYILGLGDRHPCNLLIHQYTGKVVHIDFGDCFEVAMLRDKLPEKVPFRLTRMLTQAMEVSGFEGTFRITCETVMALIREHKESVMAVLEAFVYDPLINWRLLESQQTEEDEDEADLDEENKDEVFNNAELPANDAMVDDVPLIQPPPVNKSNITYDNNGVPVVSRPTSLSAQHTSSSNESNVASVDDKQSPSANKISIDDNDERRKSVRFEPSSPLKISNIEDTSAESADEEEEKVFDLDAYGSGHNLHIHEIYRNSISQQNCSMSGSLPAVGIARSLVCTYSSSDGGSVTSRKATHFRKHRVSSLWMPRELNDDETVEKVNAKALQVLRRVSTKLKGKDVFDSSAQNKRRDSHSSWNTNVNLNVNKNESAFDTDVSEQVQRLLLEATDHSNLAQAYLGWCPLW